MTHRCTKDGFGIWKRVCRSNTRTNPYSSDNETFHASLINQGPPLISESHLDVFFENALQAAVPHKGLLLKRGNYYEIIKGSPGKFLRPGDYGGPQGLAAVDNCSLGSVCERVVRRIKTDILVVKNNCFEGKVVAVDAAHSLLPV